MVGVSALYFFQCFDTVDWVKEGCLARRNPVRLIAEGSFPEPVEEKILRGTG